MNSNRVVPYLSRFNSCEGTRKKPEISYVTRGGKQNSLIFHTKENGQFFQYRAKLVNKESILLMCIYKRNIRSSNCHAFITVTPNRENLIVSKKPDENSRARFFINFDEKIDESSFADWTVKSSNGEKHSQFCLEQIPFHLREFSQFIAENGTPAVISGHLAIDQTKLDFNFDLKGKLNFV